MGAMNAGSRCTWVENVGPFHPWRQRDRINALTIRAHGTLLQVALTGAALPISVRIIKQPTTGI